MIQATVSAVNARGASTTSAYNTAGATVAVVPEEPTTLAKGAASSYNQIQLTWSALTGTATGGSPITSYVLYWDNGAGGGTTSLTLMDSLVTTYTVTGLTAGTTYAFRLQGKNIYGLGVIQTTALSIKAEDVPATMSAPTVTLNYPNMVIDWSSVIPAAHGATIDEYTIEIYNPTTTSNSLDTTNCDGTNAAIILAAKCEIPISTLRSTHGYEYGIMLQARVRAHNSNGYGGYSSLNSAGAELEGPPTFMNTPLKDDASSTATTLALYWSAITLDS